jgi:CHAT domain-containing protein
MGVAANRAIVVALLVGLQVAAWAASPRAGGTSVQTLAQRLDVAKAAFDRRAYPQAIDALAGIIRDAESAGDRAILARALYYTGRSRYFLTDYRAALPLMQRALMLSRDIDDKPFEGEALLGICRLHKQQGTYEEGMRVCAESIDKFTALGLTRDAGRAWMVVGAIRDLRGEFVPALEAYERARVAIEPIQDNDYYTLQNEVAITYTNLARYEEALAALRISLAGREKTGDPYLIGITHSNIGGVYYAYGQFERAIEHYLVCLQMCGAAGERRSVAITLQQLANAYIGLGDFPKARDYAERELATSREYKLEALEAVALRQLGRIHLLLGDLEASRRFNEEALDLARRKKAYGDEAASLNALAELQLARGDADGAWALADQSLRRTLELHAADFEVEVRLTLARAARARGQRDAALQQLRAAVAMIDDVRSDVRTDSGKIGYLDARQNVYELLALTLAESGDHAAALEAAEAARGRAFSDLLAAQHVTLKAGDAGEFDAIRSLESRLRATMGALPDDPVRQAELLATRATGQSALDGSLRKLRSEQPELASLVATNPLAAAEIAALSARLKAVLVEYLVTDERLLIWIIDPSGRIETRTAAIDRATLRAAVQELRRDMNRLGDEQLADEDAVNRQLAQLHAWLLAPIEALLPRDPAALVYLVPHDSLHFVPFAALRDTRGKHALQRHTFAYVPAAAVLRYTAPKKQRAVSPARPYFLALADPTPPTDLAQDPLPGAREETAAAARRYAEDRRLVLVGAAANEASFKRLAAAQTVLHFAVHGLVRDDRPWESALILAPGEGQDGWLKLPEIFALDLRADLVVLSGCSTGAGKLSGDGIVGLSRAVIYAGAPSVIVSQWDVSDRSTAYLMDRFYAALVSGRDKATALRSAQLATLARHPHPALWAPFVLIGEP